MQPFRGKERVAGAAGRHPRQVSAAGESGCGGRGPARLPRGTRGCPGRAGGGTGAAEEPRGGAGQGRARAAGGAAPPGAGRAGGAAKG